MGTIGGVVGGSGGGVVVVAVVVGWWGCDDRGANSAANRAAPTARYAQAAAQAPAAGGMEVTGEDHICLRPAPWAVAQRCAI
jgi:hypothetical protein